MKGKAQWEMVTKDAYRSTVISDQKLRMTETIRIPSCGMCHDFEMISIALITNENAQKPKQKFISIFLLFLF